MFKSPLTLATPPLTTCLKFKKPIVVKVISEFQFISGVQISSEIGPGALR